MSLGHYPAWSVHRAHIQFRGSMREIIRRNPTELSVWDAVTVSLPHDLGVIALRTIALSAFSGDQFRIRLANDVD